MNNYIIDPAVFYWMNVLSVVQTAFAVIGGFILACGLILAGIYIFNLYNSYKPEEPEDEKNEYDMRRYKREQKRYEDEIKHDRIIRNWMIVAFITGLVLIILSIFIPSKQTSIEMLVARTATFDNVNWSVQQVKEIVDYIVNALKGAV